MSALPAAEPVVAPPVRRRPIPLNEPYAAVGVLPPVAPGGHRWAAPAVQGVLAVEELVEEVDVAGLLVAGPAVEDDGGTARWAAQFVQVAVEVGAGLRPASQLVRWTTEDVRDDLARRNFLARRAAARPAWQDPGARRRGVRAPVPSARRAVVRSVRTSTPAAGVVEACAVVADGTRVRAVALRLEEVGGRRRVTALEIG